MIPFGNSKSAASRVIVPASATGDFLVNQIRSNALDVVMVPDLIEPTPETKAKTTHILPSLLEVPAFLEM